MNRRIAFAIVVAVLIAALVWSERHPADVRFTPASLLYFIADSEWELTRLPMAATRLSDQEEIDIGNRLAREVYMERVGSMGEDAQQQQAIRDYVSRVGAKVAARAHRKLPYKFHYIPHLDFVNAFALPGGHVYVGGGMVALMDSEEELAAVLGHEIEHIDHYHCAERVQTEERLRKIPLGSLAALPLVLFEAGYSKDQELEADREGTRLAVWAGYSPLGAVRLFETFDRLHRAYLQRAKSPQEELSQAAIQTLEGYFRSHPEPSERIDQMRKLITDEHWGNLTRERDLEVAYIFWAQRAQQAYEAGKYDTAVGLAQHSLEMRPDQLAALRTLGNAQFAQANFAAAAAAFSKGLDLAPADDGLMVMYGDALAAQHAPARSLEEFAAWIAAHPESRSRREPRLELARLTLAAKGPATADAVLFPALAPNAQTLPPELRGRYGWWLYGLGQFDEAAKWLEGAADERPGDALLHVRLGWVLIEQHNFEVAIQRFNGGVSQYPSYEYRSSYQRLSSERRMGRVVAQWQAQQFDRALGEFVGVSMAQPEWLDPKWVGALYSPGVAKTVEELKVREAKQRGGYPRRTAF